MWVEPECRGRGVAQRLLKALTQWCLRNNITTVSLKVNHRNAEARALYRGLGFSETNVSVSVDTESGIRMLEMAMILRCKERLTLDGVRGGQLAQAAELEATPTFDRLEQELDDYGS